MAFGHVCARRMLYAKIKSIDITAAKAAAGVLGGAHRRRLDQVRLGRPAGAGHPQAPRRLAKLQARLSSTGESIVRFVGDYVRLLVAETKNQAMDACELDRGRIRDTAADTRTRNPPSPGAPLSGRTAGQHLLHGHSRDKAKTEEAFAKAAHVAKEHLVTTA